MSDLDCDGRPYQRMPRHAPPPPVTPVDPYAATEPVLTETLEQAEVPLPPAAGAAAQTEQGGEDAAEQGKRRKTEPDAKPGAAKAAAPPALAGLGDYGSDSDSGSDSDD